MNLVHLPGPHPAPTGLTPAPELGRSRQIHQATLKPNAVDLLAAMPVEHLVADERECQEAIRCWNDRLEFGRLEQAALAANLTLYSKRLDLLAQALRLQASRERDPSPAA